MLIMTNLRRLRVLERVAVYLRRNSRSLILGRPVLSRKLPQTEKDFEANYRRATCLVLWDDYGPA